MHYNIFVDDEKIYKNVVEYKPTPEFSSLFSSSYSSTSYYVGENTPRKFLGLNKNTNVYFPEHELVKENFPISLELNVSNSFSFKLSEIFATANNNNHPLTNAEIYPIAVRYIDSSNNYYIERPPFQKEITFNLKKNQSIKCSVWVPWTITVLNPSSIITSSLYFSHQQLSSLEDLYTAACLPNIYTNGKICFSDSLSFLEDDRPQDVRYLYGTIFNEYMNGGWNTDLDFMLSRFFTYASTYHKQKFEEYPAITKYFDVTVEQILKKNPHLKASTVNSIFYLTPSSYYISRAKKYLKFFLTISTFSLQETLDLYKEIIECSQNVSSFQVDESIFTFKNIIKNSNVEYSNNYDILMTSCATQAQRKDLYFSNEGLFKKIFVIIYNYSNDSKIKKVLLHHSQLYYGEYFLSTFHHDTYLKIINKALNSEEYYNIVLYNYNENSFEFVNNPPKLEDFGQYYLDFVKEIACIPKTVAEEMSVS